MPKDVASVQEPVQDGCRQQIMDSRKQHVKPVLPQTKREAGWTDPSFLKPASGEGPGPFPAELGEAMGGRGFCSWE